MNVCLLFHTVVVKTNSKKKKSPLKYVNIHYSHLRIPSCLFVFWDSILVSKMDTGRGSCGHKQIWESLWEAQVSWERPKSSGAHVSCMHTPWHSAATEHRRKPGLILLFEVISLTLCCAYNVRKHLTAWTCVRQGEAPCWLTRARDKQLLLACAAGGDYLCSDPKFPGRQSDRKGSMVWFYRKQALTGKQAHQHCKL